MKNCPAMVIEFYDHCTGPMKDCAKPLVCQVIGWLWKEDSKAYYLITWIAEDNLGDEENNDVYVILKSAVIRKRKLSK